MGSYFFIMNISDLSSFGVNPLFEKTLLANLKVAFEFSNGNTDRVKRSRSSVPMILMPRQSDKECIPSNQLSSIGFVGLILSLINAAMNIANNANSNNNDRNNNNDNNDNNFNVNIANLNS